MKNNRSQPAGMCLHVAAGSDSARPAVLAGALSRALCLINKAQVGGGGTGGGRALGRARLLVLKGSPDATEQYISVMNAIFAAQARAVALPTPSRTAIDKSLNNWQLKPGCAVIDMRLLTRGAEEYVALASVHTAPAPSKHLCSAVTLDILDSFALIFCRHSTVSMPFPLTHKRLLGACRRSKWSLMHACWAHMIRRSCSKLHT